MNNTYTTRQNDAWDAIAYRVYGSESYAGFLMEHNLPLLDTMLFGPGVVLRTPALPAGDKLADLPPWRRE